MREWGDGKSTFNITVEYIHILNAHACIHDTIVLLLKKQRRREGVQNYNNDPVVVHVARVRTGRVPICCSC